MRRRWIAAAFGAGCQLAGLAPAALAVVIASGDGTGNTEAPRPDLPWRHVGRQGAYSAVYLGNRWVLTAAHVGAHEVEFAGVRYLPIDASVTPIRNRDGSPSDLLAFRIDRPAAAVAALAPPARADRPGPSDRAEPATRVAARAPLGPPLPLLPLARDRPRDGALLLLAGNGNDRGAPLEWSAGADAPLHGWHLSTTRSIRWGTNRLDPVPVELSIRGATTRVLAMDFTPPGARSATRHEAQAVLGDSGGAVFAHQLGRFVLSGILIVRSELPEQPQGSALFGNRSFAADLSAYREQLIALTRPDCADGRDNDDDGVTDFPADPDCSHPGDDSESRR